MVVEHLLEPAYHRQTIRHYQRDLIERELHTCATMEPKDNLGYIYVQPMTYIYNAQTQVDVKHTFVIELSPGPVRCNMF